MYRELQEIDDQSHAFSWGMLASKHWKARQKIRECIYLYSICMYSIWYLCWETAWNRTTKKVLLGMQTAQKANPATHSRGRSGGTQGPKNINSYQAKLLLSAMFILVYMSIGFGH